MLRCITDTHHYQSFSECLSFTAYLLCFVHGFQDGQIQVFQGRENVLVFTEVLGEILFTTEGSRRGKRRRKKKKKKHFCELNKRDRAVGVLLRQHWCDTSVTPPLGVWSRSMWPHPARLFSYAGKMSNGIWISVGLLSGWRGRAQILQTEAFGFFSNAGERPTYRRVHQCPRCWEKKAKQNQIHFNRTSPLKRQIISVKGGNLSFGAAGTLCWL